MAWARVTCRGIIMPIFVDTNELREGGTIKLNENVIEISNLEELTGADIMLSLNNYPVGNETLIQLHLDEGAILVQRKAGLDLKESVGERMNDSLSRMRQYKLRSAQCVLLFIGVMSIDSSTGFATINRQETHMPFMNIQAAVSKWHDRGGVVEYLPRESLLQEWCEMKLAHLQEYKDLPEKEKIASAPDVYVWDDFLQRSQIVKDGRQMLACLPGIGSKTANILWDEFDKSIISALCWLTMENAGLKIRGIGEKTKQNIKEYLGLDEVMQLTVEVDDEALKRKEKEKGVK